MVCELRGGGGGGGGKRDGAQPLEPTFILAPLLSNANPLFLNLRGEGRANSLC